MILKDSLNQRVRERFPRQNWEQIDRECEMVLAIFRDPGPKSLVRLGDGELKILKYPAGVPQDGPAEFAAPMLAHSVKSADCVGRPLDNRREEYKRQPNRDADRDQALGESILHSLKKHFQVEVHQPLFNALLFILAPELIGRLAAGKRVLWITYGADVIVSNFNNPAFVDFYGLHGIIDNHAIGTAPPDHNGASAFPKSTTPEQTYAQVQQQLTGVRDFDLAFVGVGVTGKFICHHIKTALGKSAVDIGAMMIPLQGAGVKPGLSGRKEFFKGGMREILRGYDT